MKKFVEDNYSKLLKVLMPIVGMLIIVTVSLLTTVAVTAGDSDWEDEAIYDGSVKIANADKKTVDELKSLAIELGVSEADLLEIINNLIKRNDKELRDHYYTELAKNQSNYDISSLIAQLQNIADNMLIEDKKELTNHIKTHVNN